MAMLSITRGSDRTPPDGVTSPRRRGLPLVVSVGVNVALAVAFFQALTVGLVWSDRRPKRSAEVPAEHIGFLQLPTSDQAPHAGRSGGDGRPVVGKPTPRRALVAPTTIPASIPEAPRIATPLPVGGSGDIVGDGGPEQGIRPSYRDPGLWGRPGAGTVTAPRSARELAKTGADSVIADVLGAVRDSMVEARALAAGQRKPGDWTMKGPGGKWGMDQSSIHLGKISVPNALLGLLSENFQKNLRGNPTEAANGRRLALAREEIMIHANRGMNEDMFRDAVREIRARKDKERAQRLAERKRAAELAGATEGAGSSDQQQR